MLEIAAAVARRALWTSKLSPSEVNPLRGVGVLNRRRRGTVLRGAARILNVELCGL